MTSEYSIDNLILYSRCPMQVFFREHMGMDHTNSTLRGEIQEALRIGCYAYLNNIESDPYGRAAGTKVNGALSRVQQPASIRGGDASTTAFRKLLVDARYIFERFRDFMGSMEPRVIGAPYEYTMTIDRVEYSGVIDAIVVVKDIPHIITLDFSTNGPSEDILAYGLRTTLASYAYREIFQDAHKIIHYWVPKDHYLEVDRVDGQYNAVRRELRILAGLYDDCTAGSLWYRSRGFWCDSCYIKGPCNEVRF